MRQGEDVCYCDGVRLVLRGDCDEVGRSGIGGNRVRKVNPKSVRFFVEQRHI